MVFIFVFDDYSLFGFFFSFEGFRSVPFLEYGNSSEIPWIIVWSYDTTLRSRIRLIEKESSARRLFVFY